jgi:hypothetical protein
MAKLLIAVLAVAGLLAAARYGMLTRATPSESAPHRQLQNVREAAGRIESDAQRRADELLQQGEGRAPLPQ